MKVWSNAVLTSFNIPPVKPIFFMGKHLHHQKMMPLQPWQNIYHDLMEAAKCTVVSFKWSIQLLKFEMKLCRKCLSNKHLTCCKWHQVEAQAIATLRNPLALCCQEPSATYKMFTVHILSTEPHLKRSLC